MKKCFLVLTCMFAEHVPKIPHYWYEFNAFCKLLRGYNQNTFVINDIIQATVKVDPQKGSIILIVPVGKGVGECKFAKVNSDGSWDYCQVNGQDFEQWWKCVSKYTNFRKYGPEIKDTVKALFGVSEIITELDPRQIYFDSKVVKFVKFNQEYNLWMYEKESLQTLRNMIEEKIKELIGSLNPLYIEEAVRNITNDLSFTVEISGQGERKFQLPEDFRSALQTYIK